MVAVLCLWIYLCKFSIFMINFLPATIQNFQYLGSIHSVECNILTSQVFWIKIFQLIALGFQQLSVICSWKSRFAFTNKFILRKVFMSMNYKPYIVAIGRCFNITRTILAFIINYTRSVWLINCMRGEPIMEYNTHSLRNRIEPIQLNISIHLRQADQYVLDKGG